jgi:hypothetical protein
MHARYWAGLQSEKDKNDILAGSNALQATAFSLHLSAPRNHSIRITDAQGSRDLLG